MWKPCDVNINENNWLILRSKAQLNNPWQRRIPKHVRSKGFTSSTVETITFCENYIYIFLFTFFFSMNSFSTTKSRNLCQIGITFVSRQSQCQYTSSFQGTPGKVWCWFYVWNVQWYDGLIRDKLPLWEQFIGKWRQQKSYRMRFYLRKKRFWRRPKPNWLNSSTNWRLAFGKNVTLLTQINFDNLSSSSIAGVLSADTFITQW